MRQTSIPKMLLWITGVHVGLGLIFWAIWFWGGNEIWIRYFFDYQGSLFYVGMSGMELLLCVRALGQFTRKEPLHHAWFSITLAAACRFVGFILSQIFGKDSFINPIVLLQLHETPLISALRRTGLLIGGPAHMVMLGIGLYVILRSCNHLKLIRRLSLLDYALLCSVGVYVGRQLVEMNQWSYSREAVFSLEKIAGWVTDPLLFVLLLEAIFIRRASANMGWGLVAKCWGAYTVGIFITSIGDMGIWATNYGYFQWPASSIVWHIWSLASCAYALAPAYQVEAARIARTPGKTA